MNDVGGGISNGRRGGCGWWSLTDRPGFEGAPASTLDRVEAFLARERAALRSEREAVDDALWRQARDYVTTATHHHPSVYSIHHHYRASFG